MVGADESNQAHVAPGEETERTLIQRAQRGDHDAFEALLRRHQRRVLSLIGHVVRQPSEVEDIAQQVFLKIYLALPRFDFRSAFSTWVYRIAVNQCYDHLRRQRSRKARMVVELPVDEWAQRESRGTSATRAAGADLAEQAALRQVMEKLFRRLPPDDQLVLTLKELEGLSVQEIGQVMKLRENTVKVRLFRARRRLAEAYQRVVGPKGR